MDELNLIVNLVELDVRDGQIRERIRPIILDNSLSFTIDFGVTVHLDENVEQFVESHSVLSS
jgi:hypothetical protein